MLPPASHDAIGVELHYCIHEDDWGDFREFKALAAVQGEADRTFRVEIISEIRGLRADVTSAMTQAAEYLGMGKLIKFGIATFLTATAVTATIASIVGVWRGWW